MEEKVQVIYSMCVVVKGPIDERGGVLMYVFVAEKLHMVSTTQWTPSQWIEQNDGVLLFF